ncbi:PilD processed protein [Shewanella sp. NFH-SH190041]|uniref:type II secretion system protein n=1 Tax=Shewanella sp. NFH-SH190041 TaxID=2950245 RepID=UPI0021C28B10|nr:prepilin-type N-terminal cleavage/methylation domain-containing protein [Shewanella sp. NFH-SH190041]BDM64030.1 PilD processed protein [Shewanella sp. NFH-SH190041]
MKRFRGFTLIELVIVIVILGILAAVAMPKFVSLTHDAHNSRAKSAFAAFTSGVNLYHACWLANGAQGFTKQLACFPQAAVFSTDTGFPLGADDKSNPDSSTQSKNGTWLEGDFCRSVWQGLLADDYHLQPHVDSQAVKKNTDIIYWYTGNDLTANPYCYFTYVSENHDKTAKNLKLRYYPYTGKTEMVKETTGSSQ